MTTLAAAPASPAQELFAALQQLNSVLARNPEKSPEIPVPWPTPQLLEFIDIAVAQKLWLLADHLLSHLATRAPLTREQSTLATRVRNLKATMFVQVAQVDVEGPLAKAIGQFVADVRPRVILDVGAATGLGTTRAFQNAVSAAGLAGCTILSMESEPATFELLRRNTAAMPNVRPVLSALITDLDVPPWLQVKSEIARLSKLFTEFPEDEVHAWYTHGVSLLAALRREGKAPFPELPGHIDIAMIDADLFFAREELAAILPRTTLVLLDDVHAFKNTHNHQLLSQSKDWIPLAHNAADRHGWSAFRRA